MEGKLKEFEGRLRLSDVQKEETAEPTTEEKFMNVVHFLSAGLNVTEIGSDVPSTIFEARVRERITDP